MPSKRKTREGISEAVKRFKQASNRRDRTTSALASVANPTFKTLTKDEMTEITDRVAARMEKRLDDIFNKINPRQDNMMQQQINSLTNEIQGEGNESFSCRQNSQSDFTSCSLKTRCNISDKIKEQIWAGKYIEFQLLLDIDDVKFKLHFEKNSDNPELSLIEEKNRKPLSLNQWLSAWNQLSSIIFIKGVELAAMLPHHMENILEMHREGGDWTYYHRQFRKLIEKGEAQWGSTHLELYLRAKLKVNQGQTANRSSNPKWPLGVCFSYHKGLGCRFNDQCKFQHRCFNCGFDHPFSYCKKSISKPFKHTPTNLKSLRQGHNNQPFLINHPLRTYGTLNIIQNKTTTGGDTSKPVGNRKQT
jgi:hypothetical protein